MCSSFQLHHSESYKCFYFLYLHLYRTLIIVVSIIIVTLLMQMWLDMPVNVSLTKDDKCCCHYGYYYLCSVAPVMLRDYLDSLCDNVEI